MPRFLIILFLLSLGVFAQSPAPRTVIVFGDSITAGGALPKEERGHLWVTQVQQQSARALTLINEGKGGRPTNSLPEFDAMLTRHAKADALVIALGMNDSRDITPQCIPKAVANVRAMIVKARAAYGEKLPVLLVGPSNINKAALGPTKPIANEREAKLRELGAEAVHNYKTDPAWDDWALAQTGGLGVDRVIEIGGPETLNRSIKATRFGGHISLIGVLTGTAGDIQTVGILRKGIRLDGIYVGSRAMFAQMLEKMIETQMTPIIDSTFDFDQAPKAFQRMASGQHSGKIVIRI